MAAPFKGPAVDHRTSRKIAIEKSDPRHFTGGKGDYCGECGTPDNMQHGHYADPVQPSRAGDAASQPHEHQKSPIKGV